MIKLWMPLQKSHSGDFVGILSDNSIDRDGEFMSKQLLQSWVANKTPLPMLANHENKLEKLIGGWHEKELVSKNGHSAMKAKPFFLESNPLGVQAKAMVEEALAKGLGIGISIGAIPKGDMIEKEVDGKKYKGYTEAEILEATIVPIQSNRNASFSAVAKSFDIDLKNKDVNEEVIKMEEKVAQPVEEVLADVEAKSEPVVEEPKVEEKVEEPKVEEKVEEAPAEEEAPVEEKKSVSDELDRVTKELEALKEKAVLKATVEGPAPVSKVVEPSFVNLMKQKYGGNV